MLFMESVVNALRHYAAKAVYLGYLLSGSVHDVVKVAELVAQKLRRSLSDISYAQTKHQSVQRIGL